MAVAEACRFGRLEWTLVGGVVSCFAVVTAIVIQQLIVCIRLAGA